MLGLGAIGAYAIGGPEFLIPLPQIVTIAIFGEFLAAQARLNDGDPTPHNLLPMRRHHYDR